MGKAVKTTKRAPAQATQESLGNPKAPPGDMVEAKAKSRRTKKTPKAVVPEPDPEPEPEAEAGDSSVSEAAPAGEDMDLDSEEEAELAAYLDMMKEKGLILDKDPASGKVHINNTIALKQRLSDFALPAPLPVQELLAHTAAPCTLAPGDASDDLKRELAFYQQALSSVGALRAALTSARLPFSRPADYFAEMIKSDAHMLKVRGALIDEAEGIKRSQEAKRIRDGKKFGKKVEAARVKEKTDARVRTLRALTDLRKHKRPAADAGADDFDIQLEDALGGAPASKRGSGSTRGGSSSRGAPANRKRAAKDAKFGFGGKKRHLKDNTRESTNDVRYPGRADKADRGAFRGGRGGRGGARGGARGGGGAGGRKTTGMAPPKRLGKSRRMKK